MLAGLFVPHSVGCDDQSHRPISIAVETVANQENFLRLVFLWPYGFAFATLSCIGILVIWRPACFDKALLLLPITFAFGLSICWTLLLFSGAPDSRAAMTIAAITAPLGTAVGARMLWLYRAEKITAAASWGQGLLCVLAAFSLRWFWFPPVTRLLWGGVLSIAAAILMMFASWTWTTRARYDLIDRSTDPLPFQISLRQIIIGVTLTAIALTYWRAFGS